MKGRGGENRCCTYADRGRRRWGRSGRTEKEQRKKKENGDDTVKRHHKSLPPASPRSATPPSPSSTDRVSLLSSALRNSNASRHRPPRALYGPGRSEMVACLSGSLRAAVKAADLVSRRLSAESRVAKKMRRESQVFSGSFRRTKRRRCPPPCQGSIP